jgi:hypothetical protein
VIFRQIHVGKSSEIETESEALRDHRARAQWDNWLKDLRTELYQILYETPIYPKNLYLERAPMKHAEYRNEVILKQIAQMHDRGIWAKPGC